MRTLLVALLVAAAPGAASAGPTVGLRLGWEAASGEASKGTPMSDVVKAAIPLQLDLGWRFGAFSLAAYYGFGFGRISSASADACDAAQADCSAWTMRTGIQAEWAFLDVSKVWAPWVGGGIGYEWAYDKVSSPTKSARQTLSGWQLLSLEGGADARVTAKLWLGPYVSAHYGQYSSLDGYGIPNKAFHRWYGLGVRATWEF
jgi:hypothetical protein